MVKSRRLLGLQVIDLDSGRAVGRVNRLIFDPRGRRVCAFVVASGHWPAEDQVLEWGRAAGVGQHAITVRGAQSLARPASVPELQPLLRRPLRVYGTRVLTEDGDFLGSVEELLIDPRTGQVERVILAPAGLAQRLRGRASIPADAVLVMGEDAMVVRAATVAQPARTAHLSAAGTLASGDGQARPPAAPEPGRAAPSPVASLQAAARRGWAALRGRRAPPPSRGGGAGEPGQTPA